MASKIKRNLLAVSPMYFVIKLSRRTIKSGKPNSPAKTEAVKVLPVPGGPTNRSFLRGVKP